MAKRRWKYDDIQSVLNGENPFIQSGYTAEHKDYKIGDEWKDAKGVIWKKTENGIVRVNKQMDLIRDLVKSKCSVCQMDISCFGDKVDKKVYAKTGKCFSCLEIEEQTMRIKGEYEKYEQSKLVKNRLAALKEFKRNVVESINYLKQGDAKLEFVCSNGDIVTWSGAQNGKLLEEAENDLKLADEEISKIEKELTEFGNQ